MRSIRLLAATTVIAFGAWSCGGDDGGGVGPGSDPVASFTLPTSCTANTACTFTDTSTDPDGSTTITTRSWNFGDGPAVTNPATPVTHTYAAPGTYAVTLTVTDNSGRSNTSAPQQLTVGGTTGGVAPTAVIDPVTCTGLSCPFSGINSTDDVSIVSYDWDFGDPNSGANNTATGESATHDFSAAGTYTVTLTVTDGEGLTGSATQSVTVSGPTGQSCTATGATEVTCNITLAQNSTVAITLQSENCEIGNNNVLIPPPGERAQTVFFNVCNQPTPSQPKTLVTDAGAPMVFPAGTQLPIVFRRGADPIAVGPEAQITNTASNSWSIAIDDGGDPGQTRDFDDVTLSVVATPQ